MDVRAAGGDGGRMLRRVIALLAAFAVLAERVAGRSPWVRLFVLWILRRAETAATDFVFEEAGLPPLCVGGLEGIAAVGNEPADALRLAARFHALAAMLRALLPLDRPFGRRPARNGFTFGDAAAGLGRGTDGCGPMPFDTS